MMEEFAFNIQVAVPADRAEEFQQVAAEIGVLPAVRRAISSGAATIYLAPGLDPAALLVGLREGVSAKLDEPMFPPPELDHDLVQGSEVGGLPPTPPTRIRIEGPVEVIHRGDPDEVASLRERLEREARDLSDVRVANMRRSQLIDQAVTILSDGTRPTTERIEAALAKLQERTR